nr:MAG TPA: hypothetical protein [Caudoviricetes sp.]
MIWLLLAALGNTYHYTPFIGYMQYTFFPL